MVFSSYNYDSNLIMEVMKTSLRFIQQIIDKLYKEDFHFLRHRSIHPFNTLSHTGRVVLLVQIAKVHSISGTDYTHQKNLTGQQSINCLYC